MSFRRVLPWLVVLALLPVASALTLEKQGDPAILPTTFGNGVAFNPSGSHLGVGGLNSPYITFYSVSGVTLTKVADPASLPTGQVLDVAWSPDGGHVAVAHDVSPFVTVYSFDGSTFTKLANPGTLPTGLGKAVSWNQDSDYLAVGHNVAPYLSIYSLSAGVLTKVADPATLPLEAPDGVAFSPNGDYLAVGSGSNVLDLYEQSGATFTALADPSFTGMGQGGPVAWHPDGARLVQKMSTAPYATSYTVVGSTVTRDVDFDTHLANGPSGVRVSPSGNYVAFSEVVSPYLTTYEYQSGVNRYVAGPSADVNPTGAGQDVAWSADESLLAVAHTTTPFISLYTTDELFASTTPTAPAGLAGVVVEEFDIATGSEIVLEWPLSADDPNQDQGAFEYQIWINGNFIQSDPTTANDGEGFRTNVLVLGGTSAQTYTIQIKAVNGFLESGFSCAIFVNDEVLGNLDSCGSISGASSLFSTTVTDTAGGLHGFCSDLMGDSDGSLFLCGLIFVVTVFLGMAAAFAAIVRGGNGMASVMAGSVGAFGTMIFNVSSEIWGVVWGVVLIVLAAAAITALSRRVFFGSGGAASE